ncbi:hypothetical protein N7457_000004 (mitochondrion) [Penicillium paradoxum]|uniref:uncharacterized protein n=1 Tax=Penicillium paradoxum TaxID=176176 RepID=UPI0025483332|nr:uncharacterized protein N7457_000001 [Penicillium paradoxum]XP_057036911.1 uncharacterized protein N7457_000004 [Penicillium paradoxum]KAJ5798640.1 hypothetical protein N7457_000001 [Penicillium paradoxum]KAJ5798642.1 hypothetical protein N7457_000004 [Penicillium paradoxum]
MTSIRKGALYGTVVTIILAVIFTFFQGVEYSVSSFTISDSVYGSCFYFGTGFHGLHVIIGTAFLAITITLVTNQVYYTDILLM